MRMLICGLPGSGKTTLAKLIARKRCDTVHFNADAMRGLFRDWDFSADGRLRQAWRMRQLADMAAQTSASGLTLMDFVAPTPQARAIVKADCLVHVNTIRAGRFKDTNAIFQAPTNAQIEVTSWHDFEDVATRLAHWTAVTTDSAMSADS